MFFLYNEEKFNVNISKKNNKNLYIRVDEKLNINITCPFFYSDTMIKNILEDNKKEVGKMILSQQKRNKNKNEDEYSLLGKKLNIIFEDINKPLYIDNTLHIKDKEMLDKWYKKKAKELFLIYLDEAYQVFEEKIPYPKLKIRQMKTRWGVNNRRDNSITLNLELIKKDQEYLNYVIVHELSHFVHFDHSKEFWKTVEKYCPMYKKVRKELKER